MTDNLVEQSKRPIKPGSETIGEYSWTASRKRDDVALPTIETVSALPTDSHEVPGFQVFTIGQ